MATLEQTMTDRLPAIQAALMNWWEHGDQEHPLFLITTDSEPLPELDGQALEHWWTDVPSTLDWRLRNLERQHYFGAAVPYHYIDLGASAMPAVMGCPMEYVNADTIWAHPVCDEIEEALEFPLATGNRYHRILAELTLGSLERAPHHHFVTPWALGGVSDNAAALYGTENLMMDMIEEPESVERLLSRMREFWLERWHEFQAHLSGALPGNGIGWCGIWAPGSTFPIQEDFSYMISPEMYEKFCLPSVRAFVAAMDYPLYHLDGEDALKHLDLILDIEALKAVQWQPGAGKERLDPWFDVVRKIQAAGKSVQLYGTPDEIDLISRELDPRGLMVIVLDADAQTAEDLEKRYPLAR